jgi:YVTN family beta-propeller protein
MKGTRSVAAATILVLAACSAGGASPSEPLASASPSAAPTPLPPPVERTATVLKTIPLAGVAQGTQMALDTDAVWLRLIDGNVARVNPSNGEVVTIPVGSGEFGSLAVGEGAVWVTTFDEDKLSRVDPATNTVVADIPVGTNPEGIAVTPGAVWVSNHRGGSIWRIDPETNAVVAKIEVGPTGPSGPKDIQSAFGALWTSIPNASVVIRLNPETNAVATIPVAAVENVTIGDEFIYATDALGQINEIQPDSNEVVRRFYPDGFPWVFANGAFWGTDGSDLLRLDPTSFAATEVWHVAGGQTEYAAMVFTADSVWLLTDDGFLLEAELSA